MELSPKNDYIFKRLFTKNGNEDLLKDFLEALLHIDIVSIKINKDITLDKERLSEKIGILDLKAELNGDEIAIIEMQISNKYDMEKRSLYYASKVIASELEKGEVYKKLKKLIVINILDYNITKREEYLTETITVAKDERNYEMMKDVKYYFIELPKFRKKKPDINNKLEQWLLFLNYDKEEMGMMEKVKELNPVIKKATEEYEYLTGEEEQKRLAELREKAAKDEATMLYYATEDGKKEGRRQQAIETAKEMLKNNIEIEIIEKCTGLSKNEILKLKND